MKRSKRKTASEPSSSNSSPPVAHSSKRDSKTVEENSSENNGGQPAKLSKKDRTKTNVNSSNSENSNRDQVSNASDPDLPEEFPEKNPLLTHVVFSKILKFDWSLHDIKKLRIVCKPWYKYTLNKYRSIATIRLGPTGKNLWGELEWSELLCRAWNFEDYFKRFLDPNDFYELMTYPYTKYIFKGLYFGSSGMFINGTKKLWNVIGPEIRHLKFEDCTFPVEKQTNNFNQIFTENLQNLETLEFSECRIFPPRETEKLFENWEITQTVFQASPRRNVHFKKLVVFKCLPMDLSILLINSPNIESIDLDCQSKNEYRFYQQLADICNARRMFENQSYPLRQIKLNLKTASAGDTGDLWTSMNLPLEHISYAAMPVERGTTRISAVSTTTASCANTLKTFEVFQPPVRNATTLQNLPTTLNTLEEIHCYGNVFADLNFLNNSPNLKVLYLEFKLYNNLDKIFKLTKGSDYMWQLEDAYFPKGNRRMLMNLGAPDQRIMENLVRFHIDVNFDPHSWEVLPQWMPNLKILEAPLRKEAFRKVCKNFTDLEELVVLYESHVGDCEISGLKDDNASGTRNPYNLTSMKGLKKFVLKKICGNPYIPFIRDVPAAMGIGYDEAEGLGDCSVFRGFLEMSNLEQVQFHASPNLTENAVTALKQHVVKVDIIRSYGERPHGNGECCKVEAFLESVYKARKDATEGMLAVVYG